MPKIVITDYDMDDTRVEAQMAADAGVELAVFEDRSPEGIIKNAADADGIVFSYGNMTRAVIETLAPKLKVISRTGVGFDTIDVPAATEHGVAICTPPGYGNEVVSDHAITLALAVLRRINELDRDIKAGVWDYAATRPLGQVYGRTFGVVGMGAIGRAVARKAAGLGFRVICCSRSLVPHRRTPEGYETCTYEELLERADVVSFHCALTPQTHHLLDAAHLALMKPGAVVVNTSRGAVVDTIALADALEQGKLWGAGIDVFETEPVEHDHPLLAAPHTVLSAHAAYFSEESGMELRTRTMQAAIDVVSGRRPADCINPEVFDAGAR
ncbi:MAG: C-terminal binding protein [Coriobacteriales bacterium]|nr:C-terminal binding protein [Coriobacteriales bacterium]